MQQIDATREVKSVKSIMIQRTLDIMRGRILLRHVVAIAFLFEITLLFSLNLHSLITIIPDDSFFYLIIARNFPGALDFTFDGIHTTYGFQPLWQLCLLPLGALFQTPTRLLYATLIACSALHVLSAWKLYRLLESLSGRLAAASGFAFWTFNPSIIRWHWGAKENGLYAFLLLVVLVRMLGWIRHLGSNKDAIVSGVLLGLLVLARVNFVLLCVIAVPTLIAARYHVHQRLLSRQGLRSIMISLVTCGLAAVPWFLWSMIHFNSALPTSGLVKLESTKQSVEAAGIGWLSLQHFVLSLRRLPSYFDQSLKLASGPWGPVFMALAFWYLILGLIGTFHKSQLQHLTRGRASSWLVVLLALLALANSFISALTLPDFLAYGQWYTVPEYIFLAVVFGLLAAPALIALRSNWPASAALICSCLLSLVLWSTQRARGIDFSLLESSAVRKGPHPNAMLLEVGLWANKHVSNKGMIGIWDPGIVSYFAQHGFVSLDPLMNSFSYFQDLRQDQIAYLKANNISYVFGPAIPRGGGYDFFRLPEGSYQVIWVPFPNEDLGWSPDEVWRYTLIRPLGVSSDAFLTSSDFNFGEYLGG